MPIAIGDSVVRGIDRVDPNSPLYRELLRSVCPVGSLLAAREKNIRTCISPDVDSMMSATRVSTIPAAIGVLMGIAWHQYARSGNGYIVGPGIVAAFIFCLALLLFGAVLLALGKKRQLGVQLIVLVAVSVGTLWLLSVMWPPPSSPPPVPLSRITGWENHTGTSADRVLAQSLKRCREYFPAACDDGTSFTTGC